MALKTVKFSEIPANEKPISKREAIRFQRDLMETLCPKSRRVFVNYGKVITSFACSVTSLYLHSYYRKSVNVLFYRRFHSTLPVVILPGIANMALHQWFITENIIIQKWACPVCYHLRSALLNLSLGLIYPAFLSPIVAFAYSRRIKSSDVPPLNSKKIWNFLLTKTKPIQGRLGIFACFQLFIGVVVVELEAAENNYFNQNINKFINEYAEREAKEARTGDKKFLL